MSAPRHAPRLLCCVLVLLAAVVASPRPLAAQELPETYVVDLIDQPVWHRPSDPLDLRIAIRNNGEVPIEGFLLSLTAHPVVGTRSALHLSFEGTPGAVASALSEEHDLEIAPGDKASVLIDEPLSSLSSLAGISEGGVYPLTITVSDPTGVVQYGEVTTPLIVYPTPPEVPLNLAVVLPLNALPSRGADGTFRDPTDHGGIPLEEAVGAEGWLTGLIAALEAQAGELPPIERRVRVKPPRRKGDRARGPRFRMIEVPQRGLHLGLAPTPRLIEELADAADGYRRVAGDGSQAVAADEPAAAAARDALDTLRDLLQEEGVQPLLVPYSFPDLPALVEHAPDRVELELDEGAEVIESTLGVDLSREWLFPPAGRLGARTLDEIRFQDPDTAERVLFQPAAFATDPTTAPVGCPVDFASFTCPVAVRTSMGPTTGLVSDQGLQDRFVEIGQKGDERLDLQRFFAETAAIRQEVPSVPDRVAHVTVPSLWHAAPGMWDDLLAGLRDAPWLTTVTPDEAVALREPVLRTDAFVTDLTALSIEPEETFFDQIGETTELVEDFRRMQPPDPLITRLRRNTLVAESRLWWPSADLFVNGAAYLAGTEAQVEGQVSKVTIGGPAQINLTSQEGEIPLVVSNGTNFPTTVRISVRSLQPDLSLTPLELEPQRISAHDAFQFTVQAASRSSGIFPVEVTVETPEGELEIATKQVTVRSTEFNRVALAVTLGAFAFLVLFYVVRLVKKRRPQAVE